MREGVIMTIVPMRDLKDTVKIENLCHEKGEPVFVTKNGYGSLVVMDMDYYEKIMREAYEAMIVAKGLDDAEKGRVKDGSSVMAALKEKYDL